MTATKTRRTMLVSQNVGNTYLVLAVQDGKRSDSYTVYTVPGGVRWSHRVDASRSYTVTVTAGAATGCGCDGWKFGGKCRHVAGVRVLAERGELDLTDCDRDDLDGYLFTTERE